MSASKPLRLRILEAMLQDAVAAHRTARDDPARARMLGRRVRVIQRDVDAERSRAA